MWLHYNICSRAGLILFRKHAAKYIAGLPNEPDGSAALTTRLRVPLLTANTVDEFDRIMGETVGVVA